MKFPYEEFDLSGVRTYPLAERQSKVHERDLAHAWDPDTGVGGFFDSLPNVLAAADFRAVIERMRAAAANGHGLVWGLGAHVIKTGLAPVLIDLMERGFVSALAMN